MSRFHWKHALGLLALLSLSSAAAGEDWARFRGPNGTGISHDTGVPGTWSSSQNLRWKTKLPGFGSSSPIVVGSRVFLTCYSGLGTEQGVGRIQTLKRQLLCINRDKGDVRWTRSVDAELPEDEFNGYLTEHGYASNTPTSDGVRVYVFFGKSGVFAFDMDGNRVWQHGVGKESSNRRWGSAASPILYKDSVIVNAAEESNSIRALDRKTGKELWKAEANRLELAYGTPALVTVSDSKGSTDTATELVVSVPGELWGFDPDKGKLRWHADTKVGGNVCPSPLVDGQTIYVFGGIRPAGSHAIKAGGRGDVTDSNIIWTSRNSSYVATPLLHEGHLYWVDDRGLAWCLKADTGAVAYRERVPGLQSGGRPVYASPILAGDKIFVVTRWDGTLVLPASPSFKLAARNQFSDDDSDFNATPAISDGELFLRSNLALYCVSARK